MGLELVDPRGNNTSNSQHGAKMIDAEPGDDGLSPPASLSSSSSSRDSQGTANNAKEAVAAGAVKHESSPEKEGGAREGIVNGKIGGGSGSDTNAGPAEAAVTGADAGSVTDTATYTALDIGAFAGAGAGLGTDTAADIVTDTATDAEAGAGAGAGAGSGASAATISDATTANGGAGTGMGSGAGSSAATAGAGADAGTAGAGAGSGTATAAGTAATTKACKGLSGKPYAHRRSKLGRKGDPRMHRAVAARLADPDMSLLDALRAGGFDFPECEETGGALDGNLVDSDKVQLSQRKNQLSRRLRLSWFARQAEAEEERYVGVGGGDFTPILASKKVRSRKANGNSSMGMPPGAEGSVDASQNLTAQAYAYVQTLAQHTQKSKTEQNKKGGARRNKRKSDGGFSCGKSSQFRGLLGLDDDEVRCKVIEQDSSSDEDEKPSEPNAKQNKKHHLLRQYQPPVIATMPWGSASQLGLADMAAAAAQQNALAPATSVLGSQTAAQQLGEAVAFGTTDNAAQGSVPAAAQGPFSFWPPLAGMAVAGGAVGAQQMQAQAQAQAQAVHEAAAQPKAHTQAQVPAGNGGAAAYYGENSPAPAGGQAATANVPAQQASLMSTPASLGLCQNHLAAILGIGSRPECAIPVGARASWPTGGLGSFSAGHSLALTVMPPPPGGGGVSNPEMHSVASNCSSSSREQIATQLRQAVGGRTGNNSSNPTAEPSLERERKMAIALDMFRTESASLLKRCMLVAGFEPSQTEECDSYYLEFAERCSKEERQRITRIQEKIGVFRDKSQHEKEGDPNEARGVKENSSASDATNKTGSVDNAQCNGHNHGNDHCHNNGSGSNNEKQGCFDGRHVHRLEGKCGHRAIIHQPEGGQPHVDFIVDDKVECYEGMQGFKDVGKNEALWPSMFSCDQLTCEKSNDDGHNVTCGLGDCSNGCTNVTKVEPKVINLSDIDFDDNEWKLDSAGDETLLGLIALGDKIPT